MGSDRALRHEIRHLLNDVRSLILGHTGLYAGEDLTRDVLRACDEVVLFVVPDQRVEEARRLVVERCKILAQATDRFAVRDPVAIATARTKAIAAIDLLQDAVVDLRRIQAPVPGPGNILRQRSI